MGAKYDTAMAIAALRIGGMVVARSMNDRGLGDRLRDAATNVSQRTSQATAS
jgi:hypothetical protein